MKLELEGKDFVVACVTMILLTAILTAGQYFGRQSINQAAVDIDKNTIEAAAETYTELRK